MPVQQRLSGGFTFAGLLAAWIIQLVVLHA